MSPSTASTKSICLTLSLAAVANNKAAVNAQCESCATFESATYIGSLPLHLPLLTSSDYEATSSQYNASTYDDDVSLPAELAEMIYSASSSSLPSPQPSTSNEMRYYAIYSETEFCTSSPASQLEAWETSYASLGDCCESAFGYDYETCMNPLSLPEELAAMINSEPAASPTLASPTRGLNKMYYFVGDGCASKAAEKFESWEESYATKEDCCDVSFAWDYEDCIEV